MFDDIVYELPEDVELSQHVRENAIAYFQISYCGYKYYVPITKEGKKLFRLKLRQGKLVTESFNHGHRIEALIRFMISAVYLQIRDTVGAEIHQELSDEIKEGMSKLFDKPLEDAISDRFNKVLIEDKRKK